MAAAVAVLILTTSCGAASADQQSHTTSSVTTTTAFFDSSALHQLSIDYDEAAYQAMINTFVTTGDKEWISATVTIDGTVFSDVGIKRKGNSTLQGLRATGGNGAAGVVAGGDSADRGGSGGNVSADEPEGLPWRIKLDKFLDGQNYQGESDFVVRGGSTETSLNEAVALELIGASGLATQEATPARFSVNGGVAALRLVIENPDEDWDETNFDGAGILYKAEAGGDYSYRGDDATSYADVFSVEASAAGDDDYQPLISLLEFLDESDDATFAAELGDHLDIASFAKYLAVQDLVANSDDIEGPGNNSYLRYDSDSGKFTVVAWDQNLSFGGLGGAGRFGQAGGANGNGAGEARPNVAGPNGAGPAGRGGNILTERFRANAEFDAMYQQALTDLRAELYAGGAAQAILDTWTGVLSAQATDLVSQDTIDSEAAAISRYFTASAG